MLAAATLAGAPAVLAAPVPVIENRGQLPEEVLFHAGCGDATVSFTGQAVVVDLRHGEGGNVVRIPLDGVVDAAAVVGEGPLSARFSYFRGRDPDHWQRAVPSWTEVVYRLGDRGDRLSWSLTAGALRYRVETADGGPTAGFTPRLEGNGAGVLAVAPSARDGGGAVVWSGAAARRSDGDSGLLWSTFIGQSDSDKGLAVALAAGAEPVAVGRTQSPDFPTTVGSYATENAGLNDVFVSRFTADGSALVWSTLLGSSGNDAGMGVTLTADGDVVLVGLASAADWPTTAGAFDETGNGQRDAVAARLAATGDALVWSTYLGGTGNDVANRVLLDGDGCPVLVGETDSFDWPTTAGAHDRLHGGGWDAFVARLAADGSTLAACTLLGGAADDLGRDLALRDDGHVIVVGGTRSAGFPTTPGALATELAGAEDAYVACIDPSGATLVWSTLLGGLADDTAMRVVVDPQGRPVVTGGARSADFPVTPGSYDQVHNGQDDAFVARLTVGGDGLDWSTFLGGSESDRGLVLALGPAGRATVMGYTLSADLPVSADAFDTSANGSYDIFVHRFSPDGSRLLAGTYLGGEGRDETYAAVPTPEGDLLLIGMTHSADFPVTAAAYDTSYGGDSDAFLARIDPRTWYPVAVGQAARPVLTARAHPNPFNPRVCIAYELPRAGRATVRVFDARGRLVREFVVADAPAGRGEAVWDGRDRDGRPLASGTYLYEVRAGGQRARGKLALVR